MEFRWRNEKKYTAKRNGKMRKIDHNPQGEYGCRLKGIEIAIGIKNFDETESSWKDNNNPRLFDLQREDC